MTKATPATVLVVEDEPHARGLVARWLTAAGYCCALADSADAARTHLRQQAVQLVTLGIKAAGRSGIELLDEIVGSCHDTPVMILTGTEKAQTAIEALHRGACACLIEPVQREELLFHARKALQQRQLRIDNRDYVLRLEETVREQTVVIRRAHEETVQRLVSASMCRDEETGMHVRRTGLLSEVLAKAAGWSDAEAENIRLAAPMHDIGKIGIPDAILRKPGKLTPEEYAIMQTHTVLGARMLAGSDSPMLKMAEQIALNHHERWDGRGYPNGLAGYAIPESARIMAIVDVYDALAHDRVYRPALPAEEVLATMQQGEGTHFDPLLLALFFSHLDEMDDIREPRAMGDSAHAVQGPRGRPRFAARV
jgi:putative two-component system response regulator